MQRSPYDEFASALDVTGLRIRNFPSLIFLCGGPTDVPRDTGYARDSFLKYVRANHPDLEPRILLAERIADWVYGSDAYNDLLSLEEDLAHLSVLTVLFVESPGSIAELGAFSLLTPVAKKLLPVFQNRFFEKKSFIDLGPLRRLQGGPTHAVATPFYRWMPPPSLDPPVEPFSTDDAADLMATIQSQLALEPKERHFDPKDHGHQMLLIAELVALLTISRLSDLRDLVDRLHLSIADKKLTQFLFLLGKLGMIQKFPYSNDQYFVSEELSTYLFYSFLPATQIRDRLRWQQLFRDFYRASDDRKHKALRSYLRKPGRGPGTAATQS